MFHYRILQYITIAFLGVLFGTSAFMGFAAGRRDSYSTLTIVNLKELAKGLRYFYEDQDRYPTVLEFADRGVMLNYFSVQPIPTIITEMCSKNFVYTTPKYSEFEIQYCLDSDYKGGKKGWNTVNAKTEF